MIGVTVPIAAGRTHAATAKLRDRAKAGGDTAVVILTYCPEAKLTAPVPPGRDDATHVAGDAGFPARSAG